LFHNFTLIHDDIEDNSDFRRGKPTLHRMLGVPMALNTGDALYTIVWSGLLRLPFQDEKIVKIMKLMQSAFQQVVEGQGIELSWYLKNKFDISVEEYYDMVRGKTGALFGCACACATLLAGKGEEEIKEAYSFGEEIGIAFQIQDDILNIAGDFEKYKKEIGGDISEGKRTLLIIGALNNASDAEAEELISILKEGTKDSRKILRAIEIIRKNKGIEFAQNLANQHIEKVSSHLDQLPDSKWKRRFEQLVKFTVSRDH
jgi:geranylgeranyl pyrophosphate synthase